MNDCRPDARPRCPKCKGPLIPEYELNGRVVAVKCVACGENINRFYQRRRANEAERNMRIAPHKSNYQSGVYGRVEMIIAAVVIGCCLFAFALCASAGQADESLERIMRKKTGAEELIEENIIERSNRTMRNRLFTWLWYRNERRLAGDLAASLAVGQILSGALAKQCPADCRKEADRVVQHTGSQQFFFGIGRMGSC